MVNAISVDVEEYFHAQNVQQFVPRERWHAMPSRVVESTQRVLDLFARHQVRATFFVLGYVADAHPSLVKEIHRAGHEVASHGYWHQLVYSQSPAEFRDDVTRSKALLEDLIGESIIGFRAPNFSILSSVDWAYDILVEAGYQYDSSLYPVWHPRYANLQRPLVPEQLRRRNGTLLEVPLAVATKNLFGRELRAPVAGGAYWRLLPRIYNFWGLRQIAATPDRVAVCYFHPWELDPGQPRVKSLSFPTRIRHYGGTSRFSRILEKYLQKFEFGTIRALIESSIRGQNDD